MGWGAAGMRSAQGQSRVVFWQNQLSMHQSAYIRVLAELGWECVWVVDCEALAARLQMGWKSPDLGAVRLVVAPSETEIAMIVGTEPTRTIHVLGGLRGCRVAESALQTVRRKGLRAGVLAEGGDPRGVRGTIRRLAYRLLVRRFRECVEFVLAMGQTGVAWWTGAGMPSDRVFRFCYTVESRAGELMSGGSPVNETYQMVFVGELCRRKGPDLLLRALSNHKDLPWTMTFIGDGAERRRLEVMASELGISDRTEFLGVLPNRDALAQVESADLLVLPSRFDGWGAVVNESLMRGVPVVCSDRCGASDLVPHGFLGAAFPSEQVGPLAAQLRERISAGPLPMTERKRIAAWAQRVSGPSVAEYFTNIMSHVYGGGARPVPPWSEVPAAVVASR